jgi:hypothetical protein
MRRGVRRALLGGLLFAVGCGSPLPLDGDFDGDGILNLDEAVEARRDSDGDGLYDFQDLDSDGDGIPDVVEAGDADRVTAPIDTDGDGKPDFIDTDSDGDGLSDTDELGANFEVVDSDGDGVPDYRELDSDGDTIPDSEEGRALSDLDQDGTPDYRDLDSDGDGRPDRCETGDADPATLSIDTDSDGIPDYLDVDSDGDGLPDREEDPNGNCQVDPGESSPREQDTDGDGVSDLVERLAGSDPGSATSTIPATDFYFILPFQGPTATGNLQFSTSLQRADVFFSIDNTGSFDGETANIQASLTSTILPAISAAIPNAAFGVGRFRDFPLDPHGLTGDRPYELLQPITQQTSLVASALATMPAPAGGLDIPEAGYEALYQWATGTGLPDFNLPPFASNAPLGIGGVGFRPDALPLIVHITDAPAHAPADYAGFGAGTHGRDQALAALNQLGARVVGINSLENAGTAFDSRAHLEELAIGTKALIPPNANGQCLTGLGGSPRPPVQVQGSPACPVVFDVATDGTGLGSLIVDAIRQLASLGTLDLSTRRVGRPTGEKGEPLPAGSTTSRFIQSIVPVAPPPAGATISGDQFKGVTPGAQVTFKLTAFNDFVPSTTTDQLFRLDLEVLGDQVTLLDTRRVFIIVPRRLEQPIP